MELLNYSLNEYTFIFISSFLLLLSFYYQNINIYKNLLNQTVILNKEAILEQLYLLEDNLKFNKYKIWSYQFTIFALTIIIFTFNLGGNFKFVWLGFSLFLFFQFYLEYYYFYLNILIEKETTNKSFEEILNNYESKIEYINIPLNNFQLNILENVKNILFKKEDIINMSIEDKRIIYSFINGVDSKNYHLQKSIYGFRIYSENEELLELDIEDFSISKIIDTNSSYFKNFYETTSFNKIFVVGLLEPAFMSLLLLGIILIQF